MHTEQRWPLTAFISYAHEDEADRKQLDTHLAPLRAEGLLTEWHDRLIQPGADWRNAIDRNLDTANVILLLVSPDFLNSEYCVGVETLRAMQRHQMSTARVLPIILRAASWENTPMGSLQALPTGAVPINEWKNRDTAFKDVEAGIRTVCRDLLDIPGDPSNPYRMANIGDWVECEGTLHVKAQQRTIVIAMRQEVVEKTADVVVIRVHARSSAGDEDKTVSVPLDRPLEDNAARLVRQVTESVPKNAQIVRREGEGGSEKLFIGEHVYYSTWRSGSLAITVGAERYESSWKTWLCPKIPLDGIVKSESDDPALRQSLIVVDYGRRQENRGSFCEESSERPARAVRPVEPETSADDLDTVLEAIGAQFDVPKTLIDAHCPLSAQSVNADELDITEIILAIEEETGIRLCPRKGGIGARELQRCLKPHRVNDVSPTILAGMLAASRSRK